MHYTPAQSLQLAQTLKRRVAGEVYCDRYHRGLYATDASIYQIEPLAVVAPRDADDVAAVIDTAREMQLPIVPRGGGTSLSGQSIGAGIVLDFSRHMNRLEIDPQARTARVESGVVLDGLNAAAARHGLQFAPDVATSNRANIGGMIGSNSAGARSIDAGKTVDHVLSLDAILADGTRYTFGPLTPEAHARESARADAIGRIHREVARIVAEQKQEIAARFPHILRRVSGYNLDEFLPERASWFPTPRLAAEARSHETQLYPGATTNLARLIVGSEGSLATVTGALVHLSPLPASRGVLVLHFDSIAASVAAVGVILPFAPSAIELLDGLILRLAEKSLEYRNYLDFVVGHPESLVLVELSGDSAAEVASRANELTARLQGTPGLTHILPALEPDIYAHVWACRKAALPLVMGLPGRRKPVAFVEDAAVDPARLPEFVARFREIIARHGTEGAFYGHASVGCLHIRPMLDLSQGVDIRRLRAISEEVADLVVEFAGAMSGEHGDGLARSYLNERLFGPKIYNAFRQVKAAFDPEGRMNPGKVVDGPSPTENLRLGADYRPLPVETVFEYREGSFAAAAEMCNGSGVCRKLQTGTMCPSFMVTGDEEHSTRGRANALRLALSGALPAEELTGERMFQTFDLCLLCKGCKAECPSNVDVAKLKMEFLDHYYRRHGAPLGVKMMAHAGRVHRVGSALAPLSNWFSRLPGGSLLAEWLLGLDRRRPLPTFERKHLRKWFNTRQPRESKAKSRGPIVLLDDCLTSYCDTRVGRSAVTVLEAAGYEVHLAGLECCGRTHASKGFLSEAKRLAEQNIAALAPWAERGTPIVGVEPSCVAMLIDDYLDLVPSAAARLVASQAALVDNHLVRAGIELPLRELGASAIVHGHCHQKALVGAGETVAALGRIPGLASRLVDSGCCGMAGSFGYEHYDMSMAIGERVLMPAIRQAPDAMIVAPGFSCRQQIQHATGRDARHPIELIADALGQ